MHKTLAIVDADVLIYISMLKVSDQETVFKFLSEEYNIDKIWIPQTVLQEVGHKVFEAIKKDSKPYISVEVCPIHDRYLRLKVKVKCGIGRGESDGIMQILKVLDMGSGAKRRYNISFLKPKFVSNDRKAISCKRVLNNSIPWKSLANELLVFYGVNVLS